MQQTDEKQEQEKNIKIFEDSRDDRTGSPTSKMEDIKSKSHAHI